MVKGRRKKMATSLMEILCATVMLGVAALPIFGLLSYSNRGTREQEAEAEAGNLAKEEMNRLMYVVSSQNLLEGAGTDKPCTFSGLKRNGNEFTGKYCIYKHDNRDVKFKVPTMKFHNPRDCESGAETHTGVIEPTLETRSLHDLYPNAKDSLLVDIYLEMAWKLPNQSKYLEKNKIILYGRRYFNVEE